MKRFGKFASVAAAGVLCAGAVFAFAGCTTKHPKVTITYEFNKVTYAVTYTLSRYDAPKTVQHFIEVADTGFYDGLCVHDYDGTYLYGGGYELKNGELEEKDYFTAMKNAEENGAKLTQSVWANGSAVAQSSPVFMGANVERTPLYTVYGEFSKNGMETTNAREYYHKFGALAMFYTPKGADNTSVVTERNDKGKNNGGDPYDSKQYMYNSATSLFYTYTGTSSSSSRDSEYCVFGMADENGMDRLQELVDAIKAFEDNLDEDEEFAPENKLTSSRYLLYDPIAAVREAGLEETFHTPVDAPIYIKSVKVTKY